VIHVNIILILVGTAKSIADQVGIPGPKSANICLSGSELDSLSETQLRDKVHSVRIFYRTTPRHKLAIIRAYQANGDVVAMTGDGGFFVIISS
jgi:Ca2+-transporting ATPase